MRHRIARILRHLADQIEKPAPITIDLQHNLIYTNAANCTQRDFDRMAAYQNAFFGSVGR